MPAVTALFVSALVAFLVVGPLVLYLLIRSETDTDRMDRKAAERTARRDTTDDEREGW